MLDLKLDINEDIITEVIEFPVYGKAVPKQGAHFHITQKGTVADLSAGLTKDDFKIIGYQPKNVTNWAHNVMVQSIPFIPKEPFKAAIVNMIFEYPFPKSWSKKKIKWHEDNNFMYKITKPDRDNLHKNVCDVLEGKFWNNDARIVDGRIAKVYGSSNKLTIQIIGVDYPY